MKREKVLVVEDEADIREVIEHNLAREGYHTLSAPDGENGLRLARKEAPDGENGLRQNCGNNMPSVPDIIHLARTVTVSK